MTVDDIALTLQKGLGVRGAAHLLSLAGSASAVYAASEGELSGKSRVPWRRKPRIGRRKRSCAT